MKVSGIVPRNREHSWQWELFVEMLACIVDMAMHKIKSPLIVLVQQEVPNDSQGESSMSNIIRAVEVATETEWPDKNAIAKEHEAQPIVYLQVQHDVECGDQDLGGEMNADEGELDETIVDQMELDEEYKTFVGGRDGRSL